MSSIPGAGWSRSPTVFQLGVGKTLAVDLNLHQHHREKLINIMKERGINDGWIYIKGGEESMRYDTDYEVLFRQDSW